MPDMPLVATPSTYVRNKNVILILLVGVFFGMFLWDGLLGYPKANDEVIAKIADKNGEYATFFKDGKNAEFYQLVQNWPGWKNATIEQKNLAFKFQQEIARKEKWHNVLDIRTQLYIALVLGPLTIVSIWWFIHCQRRRVIADEKFLSPARGVQIPWEAITKIDNTKWKKSGIVYVTYTENGQSKEATLDEYHLDKLRPILQVMEERAPQAELIPPAGEASDDDAKNAGDAKKE
jgi:hypothetical protein